MAYINVPKFAQKIEEYHLNPYRAENWFHPEVKLEISDDSVESTLNIPFEYTPEGSLGNFVTVQGIRFGYNTRLVMQLIERSYQGLFEYSDIKVFSRAMAEAVQRFAEPFSDQDNLCYPHFLFHGLVQSTISDVVGKIENNSRIIHETLNDKDRIMKEHGRLALEGNLQLAMADGLTDDYFGIAYLLAKDSEKFPSSTSGYIAKASFFVDKTNQDIYVMTLQGRRFGSHDPVRANHPSGIENRLNKEREYAQIGNILGKSPRRFILERVIDFGRENGFKRIRVIRPEEHPMFIEKHKGFLANYEPVIKKAGITQENECYLEKKLN